MQKNQTSQNSPTPKSGPREFTLRITISAICIALALILRLMSIMIPFGGIPTMRITLLGIFIAIPAMLFGGIFGGIAGGIVDILGFLLDPQGGAYIPWLTLTAIGWGVLYGLAWKFVKNKPYKGFQITAIVLLAAATVIGVVNTVVYYVFPKSDWSLMLAKLGNKSWYMLFGLAITGGLGLLGLLSTHYIFKKTKGDELIALLVKTFITLFVIGCLMTTINGYIIWNVFKVPYGFPLYWILRIIKETAICIVSAFFITFLYPLFIKIKVK